MVNNCEECNREFNSSDALQMHNRHKHPQPVKEPFMTPKQKKKIKFWGITFIVLFGISVLIWFLVSNVTALPPTTMEGHIEVNPVSHIMKQPMRLAVHKHMLEHADGLDGGRPGIIINYNCDDYFCEDGLIEKLEAFVDKYPKHVYVAPFKNMDGKIALTKLNRQVILEEYNADVIDAFVR